MLILSTKFAWYLYVSEITNIMIAVWWESTVRSVTLTWLVWLMRGDSVTKNLLV